MNESEGKRSRGENNSGIDVAMESERRIVEQGQGPEEGLTNGVEIDVHV